MASNAPQQSNDERALAVIDTSLKNYADEFKRLLGGSVDPEVFMSVAYEAYRSNRDLLAIALTSPDSLMKALHEAATLKLVPTGVLGSAYIVPRSNRQTGRKEAYFQIGYRGLIELVMRSGHVSKCEARVVHEKDTFALFYGTNPRVDHTPFIDGDPGKVRGAYFVAFMRDGSTVIEYMSVDQINAIRERSPAKNSGPWVTDYEEMCRKTVTRRGVKYLPMSIEVQQAVGFDDAGETAGEVVATVSAPEQPTKSLAGRIRQTMAQGEPSPQEVADGMTDQQKAFVRGETDDPGDPPKNVTPASDEPVESGSPAAAAMTPEPDSSAPAANEQATSSPPSSPVTTSQPEPTVEEPAAPDEPPAVAAPKARTRKSAAKPKPEQEAAPDAPEAAVEASDDVPPSEPPVQPASPPDDSTGKFGSMAGSSETWHGTLYARGTDTILLKNAAVDAPWTGKLVPGDDDVERFFGSIDDSGYAVTIAGELKLVPWTNAEGKSMPPFRQITVKGIEVGAVVERPS